MWFRKAYGHESYRPTPSINQGFTESFISFTGGEGLEGLNINFADTAKWYRKKFDLDQLAHKGDVEAQYELAHMFMENVYGIPFDPVQALKLLDHAARQGHAGALSEMKTPQYWASQGLCTNCGGEIGGIFSKKCKSCGKKS
jgi:hypothetical protein